MPSDYSPRLGPEYLRKLRKKAEESSLTMDGLLELIMKSYFEWDKIVSDLGFVPVQEETLEAVFNYIPEADIKGLAVQAADRFTDRLFLMNDQASLDDFLDIMRIRLEKSGFSYSESADNNREMRLTVNHGLGRKWSVYFASNTECIITNLGYAATTIISDDSWTIHIKKFGT